MIRRALAKEPADRYASAEGHGARPGPRHRAERFRRRRGPRPAPSPAWSSFPSGCCGRTPEIDFLRVALSDAVSCFALAAWPALVVRSTTAGSRFAGDAPDLKAMAAELDVDLVLLGTILRSGERLRVSTQAGGGAGWVRWCAPTPRSRRWATFLACRTKSAQGIVESLSLSLEEARDRAGLRDAGQRPGLRVLPARQRAGPATFSQLPAGARPLPALRRGGPRLRAGLGPAGARPPRDRRWTSSRGYIPVASSAGGGGLPQGARAEPSTCRWPRSSTRTSKPRWAAPRRRWSAWCGLALPDPQRLRAVRRARPCLPLLRSETEASLAAHREAHRLDPTPP